MLIRPGNLIEGSRKMKPVVAPICALFLICPPLHAQEQRLCDALGIACVALEQYAPGERYEPLAYSYQTRTAGTETREVPFDPTHGLWLSTFRPDFVNRVTPRSPGPFLLNITGGNGHNTIEIFRLSSNPIRFEKVWEGYIQPQIAALEPTGGMEQHLTFAIAAASAEDLPMVGETARAEFVFLQPLHDGAWWNVIELAPAADAGTNIGRLIDQRLPEQSIAHRWEEAGLVLSSRLDTEQVRHALFQDVSRGANFNMKFSAGDEKLFFRRLSPQHPIGLVASQVVEIDQSDAFDGALGRAGTLVTQLVAADEAMSDEYTLGANETSILNQWFPQIGLPQYRVACEPAADRDRLQLYDQRIRDAWLRIERVSDVLQPGWETLLDEQTVEHFDNLHSDFSVESAQILLTDPCILLRTDGMADRLERAETAALSMAGAIETIEARQVAAAAALADAAAAAREQMPDHATASERGTFAAWRALSEAYAGADPRGTAINGNIEIVRYQLKNRVYFLTRRENYESCTLSVFSTNASAERVSFRDESCSGIFARFSDGRFETVTADQQIHLDQIVSWLDPQTTSDAISYLRRTDNVVFDLFVNAVNIDAWFYGILETARVGRELMEQEFFYRQAPYEYTSTTITSNSFGDQRIGPTQIFRFTADDFSFIVSAGERNTVYTITRDQEERFMSLTARFDPPVVAPTALQFLNNMDRLETIMIFARTDEFFAPLADQSVELNGILIPDGQMILVAGFLQGIFATMAHHLVMTQNLSLFSVADRH